MPQPRPVAIYVINLDKRGDRLAGMTQALGTLGLSFERISAVDGRSVPEAALACSRKTGPIGDLPDTTRACTASHAAAWQRLLDSDASHALVLEDDVALRPEIAGLVADGGWIPADVDLIKLEKFAPNRPSKILAGRVLAKTPVAGAVIRRMYSRHTGSAAYIISRNGAKTALALSGSFDVPVDHLLFNETVSRLCALLQPAIIVPPLAWQDAAVGLGSDIAPPRPANAPAPQRKGLDLAVLRRSLRRAALELSLVHVLFMRLIFKGARPVTLATPHAKGSAMPGIWRKLARLR